MKLFFFKPQFENTSLEKTVTAEKVDETIL